MKKSILTKQKNAPVPIINAGEFYVSNLPAKKKVHFFKKRIKTVLSVITVFAGWLAIVQYMSADKYEATVKVVEKGAQTGINPLAEKIDYGDLPKGNSLTRLVSVDNQGGADIYVKVVKIGSISELMEINKNDFILHPKDKEEIEMQVKIPSSANRSAYDGQVIIFKMPKLF